MDRFYWVTVNEHFFGETVIAQQQAVRLYHGEDKTIYDCGLLELTTHRIIWDDESQEGNTVALDLDLITKTEDTAAHLRKSAKIVLYLKPSTRQSKQLKGPVYQKKADYTRLSFTKGGKDELYVKLKEMLANKTWEKVRPPPPTSTQSRSLRMGITGIERNIEKSQQETTKSVSEAFKDIDTLMEKAKDMVTLVNQFSAKIEQEKGTMTEDETIAFKSTLLSVGIADPVTKATHGAGSSYHQELAKQLVGFLKQPLEQCGGMMTMADVYCRYNRARGMELCSPEDLMNACKMFESLQLPLRLRQFESGVLVVQSLSHSQEVIVEETTELVIQKGPLTAQDLSQLLNLSAILAKERLLLTEQAGKICRDDSIQGLSFYPNRFVE